jgi:TorA maturation chaperone TorD
MEEDFHSKLENLSRDLIYLEQELQRASSMEKLSILAQIRNVEMEILQTVRRQRDHIACDCVFMKHLRNIALQNLRMEKALEVLMKNKENQ